LLSSLRGGEGKKAPGCAVDRGMGKKKGVTLEHHKSEEKKRKGAVVFLRRVEGRDEKKASTG